MMDAMLHGHCTDEDLVGYSDVELSASEERAVRDHLASCWQCRLRSKELEEQALRIAGAIEADDFPGPQRVAAALEAFENRRISLPATRRQAPAFALPSAAARWPVVPLVAFLSLVIAAFGWWFVSAGADPVFHEVVAQVGESDARFHNTAIHQSLRVEIVQTKPVLRRSTSRLDVWSEPEQTCFASEFRDAEGNLEHALRRPQTGEQYVFSGTSGRERLFQPVSGRASITELAAHGLDADGIEAAFLLWLERRQWQPITLTSELALFSTDDRVTLLAQRVRSERTKAAFRLTAKRQGSDLTVTITLLVDAESNLPRLQVVRFENSAQAVELRISVLAEQVASTGWNAVVFGPKAPTAAPEETVALSPSVLESRPAAKLELPTAASLELREMELRYALHRAKADLGEPITIERSGGLMTVRGVVQSRERRQQVLAAIAEVAAGEYVDLDIRTIGEDEQAPATQGWELQPVTPTGVTPTADPILFSSGLLLIQDRLANYLASQPESGGDPQDADQQVVDFSNRVVALASDLLDEAWAIRRLADRYPVERSSRLELRSKWLLETMVSDHLRELSARTSELQKLVEPALLWMLRSPQASAHLPGRELASLDDSEWNESVERLFEDGRQIHDLALALLAGRQLPGLGGGPLKESSLEPVDQAMIELLTAFRQVNGSARQVQLDTVTRFTPASDVSSDDSPK